LNDDEVEAAVQGAMDCLAVIGGLPSETAERTYREGLGGALRAYETDAAD
jgi:hypothetical protein